MAGEVKERGPQLSTSVKRDTYDRVCLSCFAQFWAHLMTTRFFARGY